MTAADFLASLPIPILQAPMVGASTPAMAIAVSRAGGLGNLGAGNLSPEAIEAHAREVRAATGAPFGINLFVVRPARPSSQVLAEALERLAPWYGELGQSTPEPPSDFAPDFEGQFAALLRARPAVASFTFGAIRRDQAEALRAAGVAVVGTATTVGEAKAWVEVGADAICAQGSEAGGHRGHFLAETEASLVGTMALVPTIRAAVGLPVIGAGGIMDGRGVAAALSLGSAAVQMGTAFLLADESAISTTWRGAIETAPDDATRLTRALTGRHARGIENRFMRQMRSQENDAPAYPVQNRLTQPLRAAAAAAGVAGMLSLWAGQGVTLAGPGASGDMVRRWWAEAQDVSRALARRVGEGGA